MNAFLQIGQCLAAGFSPSLAIEEDLLESPFSLAFPLETVDWLSTLPLRSEVELPM